MDTPALYTISTPRAAEAITLADTKLFMKVDGTAEDTIIAMMITAAHDLFEKMTNLIIIDTSFTVHFDNMDEFELRRGNFRELTSVSYLSNGSWTNLASPTDYLENVQSQPFGLFRAYWNKVLPTFDRVNRPVRVVFKAGYGANATAVPAAVKLLLMQLTVFLFENRGDCAEENIPEGLKTQIDAYRIRKISSGVL